MNMRFGVWKVATAGGTIGASTMYVDPNAAGAADNLSLLSTAATQTVNHVIAMPEISLLANEHIIVQLYGYNTVALTTSRTLSLYFNDANAYVQHTAATTRPSVPALVTPANAAFPNTTTPTLTATFSDPDAANTGTVNFRVCADAACTTVISTFSSAALIANGASGSAAVPGGAGLVNGTTYYWQAQNMDNSNVQSAFSASRSFTVDTTAPAVPSLVITESNADSHASGSTFYYRPAGAGGTFTATATTTRCATSLREARHVPRTRRWVHPCRSGQRHHARVRAGLYVAGDDRTRRPARGTSPPRTTQPTSRPRAPSPSRRTRRCRSPAR